MKLYHELMLRTVQADSQGVSSYELSGFDSTLLWECRPFSGPLPSDLRLLVRPGKPVDYLANPLSWPLCSDRLVDILGKRCSLDYQILQAPLFDMLSHEPVRHYQLLNLLRRIDCLSIEHSAITYMTIQNKKVPCVNTAVFDSARI